MTSITEELDILKQDRRGRVLVPRERREALLEEFERSGMSGVVFARMVGVKYPTFASWVVAKRRRQEATVSEGAVRLLEAEVDVDGLGDKKAHCDYQGRGYPAGLIVELPGGGRLRVESPAQVVLAAELIKLVSENRSGRC